MLLSIGSLFIVLLITGYFIARIHRYKGLIAGSAGKLSSMAMVAVSSAFLGILTVQTLEYQITLSIVISGLFALTIGFLAGKPFHMLDVINGILSGFLGTLIGIVLGSMIFISGNVIIITDLGYIVCIYLLLRVFDYQINKGQLKNAPLTPAAKGYPFIQTILLASVVFVMVGGVILNKSKIAMGQIGQIQSQVTSMDEENDLQVATIDVTASGFNPKNIDFKANTMIKVIFNVSSNAGNGFKLVSKDLKIDAPLKEGKNSFLLDNPQPGKYEFMLGTGDFKGSFTVTKKK
ncbi:cupredoxin domain-containing protein [Paenibacillus radicis (ex Xue et al. 2023)]|uniref:Cupredoxin domain-containing protein n=1 Tax=Paenibacillus radicis (ex Xue et al. 2023) TaxID=2972489 RepID=A0ABT1YDE5_9BACL|nr:cupredoxin domain-containing protein [Paenibacillus radicis (ex Xue et al. 2023)]MCR8631233.1 cupredoxin domain-containing protein [Paenibacillus radicis (ex Xue et al. 2023)]